MQCKQCKKTIITTIVFIAWAVSSVHLFGASRTTQGQPAQIDTQISDTKPEWVCPMHPEVQAHEAGRCPVCKMKLVQESEKDQ